MHFVMLSLRDGFSRAVGMMLLFLGGDRVVQALCSEFSAPLPLTSGIGLFLSLSLRKESFSFFSTLQNWWLI